MATMVLNELPKAGLQKALIQCSRVLKYDGQCIITVLHPALIKGIAKREKLNKSRGMLTMPGSGGIRIPVVVRSKQEYESLLSENGFEYDNEEIYANRKVLNDKPGLSKAGKVPIAIIYVCRKRVIEEE